MYESTKKMKLSSKCFTKLKLIIPSLDFSNKNEKRFFAGFAEPEIHGRNEQRRFLSMEQEVKRFPLIRQRTSR